MEFVKKYLVDKTPYFAWIENQPIYDQRHFYCKEIPDYLEIQKTGCSCAGLINIIQLLNHKQIPGMSENNYFAGGTYEWYKYLQKHEKLEKINVNNSYAAGSLLIRNYRNPDDQGHLAVMLSSGPFLNQQLLHCYFPCGIKIDQNIKESHDWISGGYYEEICNNWINL